jgi:hypothetical protein
MTLVFTDAWLQDECHTAPENGPVQSRLFSKMYFSTQKGATIAITIDLFFQHNYLTYLKEEGRPCGGGIKIYI